jgi:hypothetical protein
VRRINPSVGILIRTLRRTANHRPIRSGKMSSRLRCPSGRVRAAAEHHPPTQPRRSWGARSPSPGVARSPSPGVSWRGDRWTAGIPDVAPSARARRRPPADSLPRGSGEAAGAAAMDRAPVDRRREASQQLLAKQRGLGSSPSSACSRSAQRFGDYLYCVRLTRSPSSGPSLAPVPTSGGLVGLRDQCEGTRGH